MATFWLVMTPSVKAQSKSTANVAVTLTYAQEENVDAAGVYTTAIDSIPVCFSGCNIYLSASQAVTWTVWVNGLPKYASPKKAITVTLTAEEGIYQVYYAAQFVNGTTRKDGVDIQIIGAPVPVLAETPCDGGACILSLRLGAPWPDGPKSIFTVKTTEALFDTYYFKPDRQVLYVQLITSPLKPKRILVDMTITVGKYTKTHLTAVVNVIQVEISLLPLITSAPAMGQ